MRRSRECAKGHQVFLARRTAVDPELCQCDIQGPAHPRYGGAHREAAIGRKDPAPDSSKVKQGRSRTGAEARASQRPARKTRRPQQKSRYGALEVARSTRAWADGRIQGWTGERKGRARPWAL